MEEREVIEKTQRFWSEYSGKDVSQEDARQILHNLRGFFRVLTKLAQKKLERGKRSGKLSVWGEMPESDES